MRGTLQLGGRGHQQNDAKINFFPNSKNSVLGLSNVISFVSKFLLEGGKKDKSLAENLAV